MARTNNKTDVEGWLDGIDPNADAGHDGRQLRAIGAALTALERAEDALRRIPESVRHEVTRARDQARTVASAVASAARASNRAPGCPRASGRVIRSSNTPAPAQFNTCLVSRAW